MAEIPSLRYRSARMSLTIALAMAALTAVVEPQPADLTVHIANVRNRKGVVHACLTRNPRHFPDCRADPHAVRSTVPAGTAQLRFPGLAAGHYAVTLFHDENRNQRLDMMLGHTAGRLRLFRQSAHPVRGAKVQMRSPSRSRPARPTRPSACNTFFSRCGFGRRPFLGFTHG